MESVLKNEIEQLHTELEILRKRVKYIENLEAEKQLYEKSLRFRNRLQKLITAISSKFISINPLEIDFWIERTLRTIAIFSEADRASVFQFYDSNHRIDNTHEWIMKSTVSLKEKFNGLNLKKYGFFYSSISRKSEIIIFSKKQLPESAEAENKLFDEFGIKSLLLIPLVIRGMLIGYIGLSTQHKEVVWTKEIMMLLKIVGEIIVNALVRKRAEDKLKQYHLIVANAIEHMAVIDREYYFQSVNTAYQRAFNKIEKDIVGMEIRELYGEKIFNELLKESLDKCFSGEEVKIQFWYDFPGLGKKYIDVFYSPVMDYEDNIIGAVETTRDITQQKVAEDELIKAKEKAEKSDQLKTEFLAQISHEIRTPINSMLSFASMLEEETEGKVDEEVKKSFKIIGKAGKRIIRTTDLIVDMAEIQAGTYESEKEDFDVLIDVIEPIYYDYIYLAKEKKLDFYIENLTEHSIINADKYSVKQIFSNIIHNSLYFTLSGEVSILLKKDENDRLVVEVSDTGIGISETFMNKIFEPFTQEDEGFTRRFEGSGLGLALSKKYCDLNNILIQIESQKDKGTKVRLIF